MDLYKIVDKWNNVLFMGYNLVANIIYAMNYAKIHPVVGNNKQFKNKHKGERCFIVLNGPSLRENDISVLENEIVFCSNYFFKSDVVKVVNPMYYCWMDSLIFTMGEEGRKTIKELQERCPDTELFMNYKAVNVVEKNEHTFFTYNKHMPSSRYFQNSIEGLSSGYTNVLGYIIGVALYMGFTEINILGLDFEPTGFGHFEQKVGGTGKQEARNYDELTHYGSILKAHSEFIGIAKYARKHGITIRNLNPNSYVRAFDFDVLTNVI